MQDMRDLYRAYSAVHDTTIKEELNTSKDQISAMNFGQLTEGDLIEVCEEIVEGLFQYGCDLDAAYEVVGSMMEATVEGELPAHRQQKIVRISEAFDKTFEKVATRAERNCEEEFLKYRTNKPLNEKWNSKLSNEVGNQKLHAALIHEDRETIKGGLIEMISDIMEKEYKVTKLPTRNMRKGEGLNNYAGRGKVQKKSSASETDTGVTTGGDGKGMAGKGRFANNTPWTGAGAQKPSGDDKKRSDKQKSQALADRKAAARDRMKDGTSNSKLDKLISKVQSEEKDSSYLETNMKKRKENNEKARKDMEKVPGQKNPHFEEVSTLRQGWTNAYASIYEKKMDPVGQEDGDIDNDGDKDSSDKYLAKRRKAIGKAMGKKGKDVDEGYKPLPQDKMMRQSHKAYRKEQDAVSRGDGPGATKQMKRRFAMEVPDMRKAALDNKKKMKKEEVTFSETELKAFEEIVNSWVD